MLGAGQVDFGAGTADELHVAGSTGFNVLTVNNIENVIGALAPRTSVLNEAKLLDSHKRNSEKCAIIASALNDHRG
jgi:hypothetical protein